MTKLLALLIMAALVGGCSSSNSSRRPPVESTKFPEAVKPEQDGINSEMRNPERRAAVRIVVFQDKSRSVNQTRTVQITEEDLLFLIDVLRVTSGELAFGVVDDRSDKA